MSAQYKQLFEKLSAPQPDNAGSEKNKEPNWLIAIPSLTKSKIEGFQNCSPIIDHEFIMNRGPEAERVNEVQKPNGSLIGYDLKIIIESKSINADAHLYFYQNLPIKALSLVRVNRVNNINHVMEVYAFTNCYITSIITKGDVLAMSFRYTSVERKTPELRKNGSLMGMHSAQHDFIKAKADVSSPRKKPSIITLANQKNKK